MKRNHCEENQTPTTSREGSVVSVDLASAGAASKSGDSDAQGNDVFVLLSFRRPIRS